MECSCSIDFDYDGDDCTSSQFTVATITLKNLTRRCDECGCKILPGISNERLICVFDKIGKTYRTCPDCLSLRTAFYKNGYPIAGIRGGVEEFIQEEEGLVP